MTDVRESAKQNIHLEMNEVCPEGTAIIYTRSARADNPDALNAEVQRLAERTQQHGVDPRLILTAAGSGGSEFAERDDLQQLINYVGIHRCEWVVTRSYDRIARSPETLGLLLGHLDAVRVELVALDQGGQFEHGSATNRLIARVLTQEADTMRMRFECTRQAPGRPLTS